MLFPNSETLSSPEPKSADTTKVPAEIVNSNAPFFF